MAKLGLDNSNEIARVTTASFIFVLRERKYKTKPRTVELLRRFRGKEHSSGYTVVGVLPAEEAALPVTELQAMLEKKAERWEANLQKRRAFYASQS